MTIEAEDVRRLLASPDADATLGGDRGARRGGRAG